MARREAPPATIVTGACGWLGRALTNALLSGEHARDGEVRALVGPDDDRTLLPVDRRLRAVKGDVRDKRTLVELFAGLPDGSDVIHAAGVIHPRRHDDFVEVNTRGTANVAAAARAAGVRRMVHVSSNSPFGTNPHRADLFRNDEPYHPYLGYGRSKMLAELRLLDEVERGLDGVIVRPPWFYGPFQPARQTSFFSLIRTGRFPLVGDGSQRRSMVYIDNLVDGIVAAELAAVEPGGGWWIADRHPYPLAEIVATVAAELAAAGYEVSPQRVRVPRVAARGAATIDRLLQRFHRYHTELHVLGELNETIACDVSVAIDELGYQPRVELAEGMRRSIAWCRDEGIEL